MKTAISRRWTPEDRLAAIALLLPIIQDDIYKGRYSDAGRPNITTLQHIINESPECLNKHHTLAAIEKISTQQH
jgi:hypothetical protein